MGGVITGFSLHWMLLGFSLIIIGYSSYQLSILSEVFYGYDKRKYERYKKIITYDKCVLVGFFLMLIGFISLVVFVVDFIGRDYVLEGISYPAIVALLFVIIGFQTFVFTLLFHMIINRNESIKNKSKPQNNE